MKRNVVTLIGSTREEFRERHRQVERELYLAGYVVIPVGLFKTDLDDFEKHRALFESIHLQKIDMADVVVLIHKDAVGEHTASEMEYCNKIRKPIVIFTTIKDVTKQIEGR